MINEKSSDRYWVEVEGEIDGSWADWIDGLQIQHTANGRSWLSIPQTDQAALMGLLSRLHQFGVTIKRVLTEA
jgi:hypothetical protein